MLKECECVFQISMACSKYDKLEPGAPTFQKRLMAAKILSSRVKRVVARIQPYFIDCKQAIISELPHYKEAGIYGIIVEGWKSRKKQVGMVKSGVHFVFPIELLAKHFKDIKQAAHENGLMFWCSDDGLDHLSDDIICCGTYGLDNFKPNLYTMSQMAYYPETAIPTEAMKQKGTTRPFKGIMQTQAWNLYVKSKSFYDMMQECDNGYVQWLQMMQRKYGDR